MKRRGLLLSLAWLPFLACCQTDMHSAEVGDAGAARKVLIAGTTSEFKQEVVSRAMEKLGTRDYHFRIIGLDSLEKADTGNFQAILLVNTYAAGRIDGRVSRYLAKDPTNPKTIVFYTSGSEDPKPDRSKPDIRVDVVASVSTSDRVERRADELAALIKARFDPKN